MAKGHCGRITRQDYASGKGKNPCGKTVKVDFIPELALDYVVEIKAKKGK